MKRTSLLLLLLASVISFTTHAKTLSLPFDRKLNEEKVYQAINGSFENLISNIQNDKIDLITYQSPENIKVQYSAYKNLKFLSQKEFLEFTKRLGLFANLDGVFISSLDKDVSLSQNTIFISTASPKLTLAHEYIHGLLYLSLNQKEKMEYANSENEYARAKKTMDFRFEKILIKPTRFTEVQWRDDLLRATEDYLKATYNIIKYRLAEEVIIESLIHKHANAYEVESSIEHMFKSEAYVVTNFKKIKKELLEDGIKFPVKWFKNEFAVITPTLRESYETKKKIMELEVLVNKAELEVKKLEQMASISK
ncbi:MAG: hypothetical protein IPM57_04780 [Oligoflexia bacterium]|nr:hypothetical protein [Oligoflexia bacterium]